MKFVDLCAGTGAFSYVFEEVFPNCKIVYANDYENSSKVIYDFNFKHELTLGDLNKIKNKDIPEHDILTGGFSCQPFSIAGKREGFNDDRSTVFLKIADIVKNKKPRIVILENVKNLLTHDNKKSFKKVKETMENLNYHFMYKVLDTCKLTGIPHHRERVYMVCFLKSDPKNSKLIKEFNLDFELIQKKPLSNFLEKNIDEKYYYSDRFVVWPLIKESVVKKNTIYQYRRTLVRENKSGEVPTLTANMGGGGHNVPLLKDDKGIRKLTPRECFNFQGFPNTYVLPPKLSDTKLYKLSGNAVSIPIVQLILKRIKSLM